MTKERTDAATLTENDRLQRCAARAQETDRLAQEADAEASRLRKEMKRARKAYREAKEAAKVAGKEAEQARAELSACLDGAFRDLALALQAGPGIARLPKKSGSDADKPQAGRKDAADSDVGLDSDKPFAASG